jgi:hypothetical protein
LGKGGAQASPFSFSRPDEILAGARSLEARHSLACLPLLTLACAGVNQYFPRNPWLFNSDFYEKWKELPGAPGKNCRAGQILPGICGPWKFPPVAIL